jgi:hypothetical protein
MVVHQNPPRILLGQRKKEMKLRSINDIAKNAIRSEHEVKQSNGQ